MRCPKQRKLRERHAQRIERADQRRTRLQYGDCMSTTAASGAADVHEGDMRDACATTSGPSCVESTASSPAGRGTASAPIRPPGDCRVAERESAPRSASSYRCDSTGHRPWLGRAHFLGNVSSHAIVPEPERAQRNSALPRCVQRLKWRFSDVSHPMGSCRRAVARCMHSLRSTHSNCRRAMASSRSFPGPQEELAPNHQVVGGQRALDEGADAQSRPPDCRSRHSLKASKHPRWLHVLPNGDVLVAEAASEPAKSWWPRTMIQNMVQRRSGSIVENANRISLLRDAERRRRRRGDIRIPGRIAPAVRNGAGRRPALRRQHRQRRALSLSAPATRASPTRAPSCSTCPSAIIGRELCFPARTARSCS